MILLDITSKQFLVRSMKQNKTFSDLLRAGDIERKRNGEGSEDGRPSFALLEMIFQFPLTQQSKRWTGRECVPLVVTDEDITHVLSYSE